MSMTTPRTTRSRSRGRSRRDGFTILEMLITVGLIMVLAAIIIASLQAVRTTANRTESVSTLRQMVMAYNAYSADHEQRLMPGFVTTAQVTSLGLQPKLKSGSLLPDPGDAESYVWRLAPYLSHEWKSFLKDYRAPRIDSAIGDEILGNVYGGASAMGTQLGLSRVPAYGLNSIFLGGDTVHGDASVIARNPFVNRANSIAATRLSEVKNPAQQIVFGPTRYGNEADAPPVPTDTVLGSAELRPPFLSLDSTSNPDPAEWRWDESQWIINAAGDDVETTGLGTYSNGGGVPYARWGDRLPFANLDGSTAVLGIPEMVDMRLWSPFVTADHKTIYE